MKDGLHNEHRKRMKERYRSTGLDAFQEHEVVELLLFFGIPYRNTNDIAHVLLNKFGSVSGILDASYDELTQVKGIGENAATLITMMPDLFRRYTMDKQKGDRVFDSVEKIGEYCLSHFIGATTEHVELLLFDAGMHMTDHVTVHKGTLSSSVNAEILAEYIFGGHVSCFALAHNHPFGSTAPSEDDLYVTREIYRAFQALNKHMIEHLVIAGDGYEGILERSLEMYDK